MQACQLLTTNQWQQIIGMVASQERLVRYGLLHTKPSSDLLLEYPSGSSRCHGSCLGRDCEGGGFDKKYQPSKTGGSSRSRHQDFHACLHHMMGDSCGGHCDKGHLVTGRVTPPHQHLKR